MRGLSRQPLARFVALGLLIVCVDSLFGVTTYTEDIGAETVVVDDDVRKAVDGALFASLGRPPTADERAQALERWVREEVLVREARALGLDQATYWFGTVWPRRWQHVRSLQVAPEPTDDELWSVFRAEAGSMKSSKSGAFAICTPPKIGRSPTAWRALAGGGGPGASRRGGAGIAGRSGAAWTNDRTS